MERNILAVGDVVAPAGVKYCKAALPVAAPELSVDFCVMNGETPPCWHAARAGEELLSAGADVITMGNHTWGRRELCSYLERSREVLRPANLPQQQPGRGWGVFETPFGDVAVIDLIGRCGMDHTPTTPSSRRAHPAQDSDKAHPCGAARRGHVGKAGHGPDARRAGQRRLGHAYPCADGGHDDPAAGHGLCDGPRHDRPARFRARHPAGAVHPALPGRSAQPL